MHFCCLSHQVCSGSPNKQKPLKYLQVECRVMSGSPWPHAGRGSRSSVSLDLYPTVPSRGQAPGFLDTCADSPLQEAGRGHTGQLASQRALP